LYQFDLIWTYPATNIKQVIKHFMRRFVPFALLIPLSTLFVSCSKGDMSNTPNPQAQVVDASEGSVVTDNASTIIVTEDNFPQAYTNLRFDAIINQAGGLNTFREMSTAPSDPAKQFVVRMNRDTHYSTAVFDMTDGVYLTIPETDKYISVQVVDENHETQPMIYGPGRHKLTAKTKYAFIAVRSLDDQARRNLKAEANSSDPFAVKEWDNESFDKVAASGNTVFTTGYDQSKAFSNTESGQTPYWNYVGAAGGWGGAMVVDNIYQTSQYMSSDGCYEMTFADPEARDFWSATVYNGDGYMFNDVANISSEMDPVKNSDGTYTLRFGCDGLANNIPIREGNKTGKFNILVRHYGPSKMVSENEEGYNPTKNIKKVN
jgi:hypothetical protein